MTAVEIVHVDLGERSYDITIGAGQIEEVARIIAESRPATRAVVITDEQVEQLYATSVANQLADQGIDVDVMSVPAGEESKSVETLQCLWQAILEANVDRQTAVLAVGGGVIGDLAGFAAASFARGLPFYQVPTTLLAQVDSSVGGKVGINLPTAKNMVGAFWQPQAVVIDPKTLATLSPRQYRAGLAEVVKYGVILDAEFFGYLESHVEAISQKDAQVLTQIISRSCQLKAQVVQQDEQETAGQRAKLNYGHTFAHALEAVAGYGTLLHGEAVSIGMMCAARLAATLGRVTQELVTRQEQLLTALNLPVETPPLPLDDLIEAMQHDKKVAHGKLRFILPDRLGKVDFVDDVPEALIREAFALG